MCFIDLIEQDPIAEWKRLRALSGTPELPPPHASAPLERGWTLWRRLGVRTRVIAGANLARRRLHSDRPVAAGLSGPRRQWINPVAIPRPARNDTSPGITPGQARKAGATGLAVREQSLSHLCQMAEAREEDVVGGRLRCGPRAGRRTVLRSTTRMGRGV